MSRIISIPLFQLGVLFIATSAFWFFLTNKENFFKKKVFNFVTDGLYYFMITTLILNVLFNIREVLQEPYRAILFSSEASWLAIIVVSFYLMYREKKKELPFNQRRQNYIDETVNFFLILGLSNHLFYYYKYQNFQSVLFILIYFTFYLVKDKIKSPRRNELTLGILTLIHGFMMYFFNPIIIYYQMVFYPYQMISLLLIASLFIFYFRRDSLSKQKLQEF